MNVASDLGRMMIGLAAALSTLVAPRAAAVSVSEEFFERRIRPVLVEQCFECHSGTSPQLKGELRLDSRDGMLRGGKNGPVLVVGRPQASRLWIAISHGDPELKMPAKQPKLPAPVVQDFERWIREGAKWPEAIVAAPATPVPSATPALNTKSPSYDVSERKRRWPWIWETPQRQSVPEVNDSEWPLGFVDRFILARLEKAGLKPAPAAEPETWMRRVHFALVGLPPPPEVLAAFLQDPSPGARERMVDQLLASPQFGERWARHWLDLVRYSESRGHESDFVIPNAYEYRDYVVRAFNADLPYNDFVREHVAGDLLAAPRVHSTQGFNESILGTGWAFLGEEIHAPVDTRQDENERIDNRIDVLSKTFLGLTVSCARCHDHKFDAISQQDYYALAGFFLSSGQRLARFETMGSEREVAERLGALMEHWGPLLAAQMEAIQTPVLGQLGRYLAAAVAVVSETPDSVPNTPARIRPAQFSPALSKAVGRAAVAQDLDSLVLGQWTAVVLNAANSPQDLFFPLAEAAHLSVPRSSPSNAAPRILEGSGGIRVLVDYGKLSPADWFADGVAFGLRPVLPGAWKIVAPWGTNSATLRVNTRGAAQANPDWRDLDLSPGVEREPTLYGAWKRDGVMVRSPKFELAGGRLYYLVRGSGRVLATVDSQRLVTGPVHTALVREWGFEDRWRWVSQDLTEYPGHRVALEFSPGPEFETAIALIVESEQPPPEPWPVAERMNQAFREQKLTTLPELMASYQETLLSVVRPAPHELADELAFELKNWLAQRPELFSGREDEWPSSVAQIIRDYLRERESTMAQIQWKSRTAPALMEGNGVDEYLLSRGKHQTPKGLVPRRFLEAVSGPGPITVGHGSGRAELAATLADPSNPLVARVMVNRLWHLLFGRGLVATVDNFGWLGQRPTHPELLDELAVSFVEDDGWSLKQMIRRLVLTRTFAMSSQPRDSQAEQNDPENLLWHRMNLKRLEGEAIRDAMLAVSGRLNLKMFGPGVPLHPTQFVEARGLRSERGPLDGDGRRSLYVASRRNFLPTMMTAFDTPTPFTTVGRRNVSNVPGQMLFLMNDPFVHQQAEVLAQRLMSELPAAADDERIRWLFIVAFGRAPVASEVERCRAALRDVGRTARAAGVAVEPWTELAHGLFGVKEFIYVR